MFTMDKEKFGLFVAQLRKEKGMTQKELAEKLYLSDKAVSKWERGAGMPDISLLVPLSELLGVSVAELLECRRMEQTQSMDSEQVESLVKKAIQLSEEKQGSNFVRCGKWAWCALGCAIMLCIELVVLSLLGFVMSDLLEAVFRFEFVSGLFGAYLYLFVKERLPSYYDENVIHAYSDRFFRMNFTFVAFNNRNWPHILRVGRIWCALVFVLTPVVYAVVSTVEQWGVVR